MEHGPNFAITPQRPLYGEYIKAIETACQSLDVNSAEELRSDVYRVFRHPRQLSTNLSKEEMTAIKQLKVDKDRIILTAVRNNNLTQPELKDLKSLRRNQDIIIKPADIGSVIIIMENSISFMTG